MGQARQKSRGQTKFKRSNTQKNRAALAAQPRKISRIL
jgi:hypothetical protein